MSIVLYAVLFIAFAIAQLLCIQKVTNKTKKYIPMLISAMGSVFAVGLYAYALITHRMGATSQSVMAENQYFAIFTLLHACICLVGSIVGALIAKINK